MKCMTLIALAPLLVAASDSDALQGKVNDQELRDDISATSVMGAKVKTGTNEDGGLVKDIVLAADGSIVAVLVEGAVASPAADQRVSATEAEDVTIESGIPGIANDDLSQVQWNRVRYNKEDGSVHMDKSGVSNTGSGGGSGAGETRIAESRRTDAGSSDDGAKHSFRASELVGMEVHLSDAESFGEVEDVLIDQREGKASALLVDAWSGFDKQTFALPVELGSINRNEKSLTYSYTEGEVTQLEEYEKP